MILLHVIIGFREGVLQTQEEISTNQHNTYLCSSWIFIHVVVSLTWFTIFLDIPIVCMIEINILQKLSKSPLPFGHSPSRPRLRHPLLYYIVPRVIHLSLSRISCTRRVFETSLSLIIEYLSNFLLLRHPSDLGYILLR
jgi:hypothetical protein